MQNTLIVWPPLVVVALNNRIECLCQRPALVSPSAAEAMTLMCEVIPNVECVLTIDSQLSTEEASDTMLSSLSSSLDSLCPFHSRPA